MYFHIMKKETHIVENRKCGSTLPLSSNCKLPCPAGAQPGARGAGCSSQDPLLRWGCLSCGQERLRDRRCGHEHVVLGPRPSGPRGSGRRGPPGRLLQQCLERQRGVSREDWAPPRRGGPCGHGWGLLARGLGLQASGPTAWPLQRGTACLCPLPTPVPPLHGRPRKGRRTEWDRHRNCPSPGRCESVRPWVCTQALGAGGQAGSSQQGG